MATVEDHDGVLLDPVDAIGRAFSAAVAAELGDAFADVEPQARPSQNPRFGDFQVNIAMSLAKRTGENPRELAQRLAAAAGAHLTDLTEPPEVAGPGFINLTLRPEYLDRLITAFASDARHGVETVADPEVVVIDYSSPNVAKEMHIGHLRSTIIGDVFARILDRQGHRAIRQNHIGDWGTQFGRVMLGLWYGAVAKAKNDEKRLARWMEEVNGLPKQSGDETPDQAESRRDAERRFLRELVPWHQAAVDEDPDGTSVFEPFLQDAFPDFEQLQRLYTFASSATGLEAATESEFVIAHPKHGRRSLASLPSLIATFVQNPQNIDNTQERLAWEACRTVTISACQEIYDRLGVLLKPADVHGESQYNAMLPQVVSDLEQAGLAREDEGALVIYPPGFVNPEGEPLGMIIRKRDGGYLYATTDLAAARYRVDELKADRIIYVTDARQSQHFAMLFAALRMAGWIDDHHRLDHVPFGTILGKDRRPFKTREGGTVRLIDVLDEAERRAAAIVAEKSPDIPGEEQSRIARAVGIGALKYADLSNERIRDYVFDWDRMLSFDGNTGPYIQYAHARICSIFVRGEVDEASLTDVEILIRDPAEKSLAMLLLRYASVVRGVAESLEPHRLCAYLYELANAYAAFYQACPVLKAEDRASRDSRLRLCAAVRDVIADGLELLGIEAPSRM